MNKIILIYIVFFYFNNTICFSNTDTLGTEIWADKKLLSKTPANAPVFGGPNEYSDRAFAQIFDIGYDVAIVKNILFIFSANSGGSITFDANIYEVDEDLMPASVLSSIQIPLNSVIPDDKTYTVADFGEGTMVTGKFAVGFDILNLFTGNNLIALLGTAANQPNGSDNARIMTSDQKWNKVVDIWPGLANANLMIFPVIEYVSTSIKNREFGQDIKIYPNPFQNNMKVQLSQELNDQMIDLEIFSSEGKLIFNKEIQKQMGELEINLSAYPPGLYSLILNNNNFSHSRQLIKK